MITNSSVIFYLVLVFSKIGLHLSETITSDKLTKNNLFDLDGIINNMFPNLNRGGNNNVGDGGSVPPQDNGNQVNNPQGSVWNNANGNPGINYPANSGFYPSPNFQGQNTQYPGNSNGMQVNNPQYPGNTINNGIYPGNINPPQVNNPQYPGNTINNGIYPGNINPPQGNNQQYPGNGFNNGNLGNYPQNPNMMQGNIPQYPGNDLSNGNPNFNYPGNSNVMQYPTQGNGLDHINKRPGINYPTNPSALNQDNYNRYPGYNNWNNNRYPGNLQNRPNFNTQGQYPGQNWNNANGLQNNQNPNQIGVPGNQQTQGLNQNPLIQGQPIRYPPNTYQNYNPGLQNGGSFPSQVSNGMNNQLPNDNLQDPNMQYPQLPDAVTATVTPPVTSTTAAMKQCVQDCPSTSEYNPICGNNNITYFNEGKFECARKCGIDVIIVRRSACPAASAADPTPGVFA